MSAVNDAPRVYGQSGSVSDRHWDGWVELHHKANGRAVLFRAAAVVRVEYDDGAWVVWSTDGNCTRVRETRDEIMDLIAVG